MKTVCFYCRETRRVPARPSQPGLAESDETLSLCPEHSIMVLANLRGWLTDAMGRRFRYSEPMHGDRRIDPRFPVAWSVRLSLGAETLIVRAVDASVHGICIATVRAPRLRVGGTYRVETLDGRRRGFACTAEVRHVSDHGAGLRTNAPIPVG